MSSILYNVLPDINEALEPERWEFIKIDDHPEILHQYTISTYGRVYNYYDNKFVAPRVLESTNKYLNVSVRLQNGGMKTLDIHRLMLITFLPNVFYRSLVCNHKDGIKCHNWIWNLEWTTNKENTIHAINNGLISMGSNRANGIVDDAYVRKICQMIQDGYSNQDIVAACSPPPVDCNVSRLIQNIKNGHCHSNISKEYDFSNAYNVNINDRRFTKNQIEEICRMFEIYGKDLDTKCICKNLGIDLDLLDKKMKSRYFAAVSSIRQKKTFQDICCKYNY